MRKKIKERTKEREGKQKLNKGKNPPALPSYFPECEGEGAGAAARGCCQRLDAMLRSLPSRCINPRSHPNTPPPHDSNALIAAICNYRSCRRALVLRRRRCSFAPAAAPPLLQFRSRFQPLHGTGSVVGGNTKAVLNKSTPPLKLATRCESSGAAVPICLLLSTVIW